MGFIGGLWAKPRRRGYAKNVQKESLADPTYTHSGTSMACGCSNAKETVRLLDYGIGSCWNLVGEVLPLS